MNLKKIFTLHLLLGFFTFLNANVWYLSTSSRGDASGSSRANHRAVGDYDSKFWNKVLPGDTVLIDGGSTSKTYYTRLRPLANGTATKKIIITKDWYSGRNGTPIFNGTKNSKAAYIATNYIVISHMKFINGDAPPSSTFAISGSSGVEVLHNSIEHPIGIGINLYQTNSCKVMYNTIKTTPCNIFADTDNLIINGGSYSEVANNYLLGENSKNGTSTGSHKDNIQIFGLHNNSKIHHNFIMQNPSTDASHTACLFIQNVRGTFEIYNNIIVSTAGYENHLIGFDQKGYSGKPTIKVYNNTIVTDRTNMYSFHVKGSCEAIRFVNNLVYKPNGNYGVYIEVAPTSKTIDYNQYYLSSTTTNQGNYLGSSRTWTQWRGLGFDLHGETGRFYPKSVYSRIPTDYELKTGSSGINEGTSVTLFNTDFESTLRPKGSAWDRGAFEYNPSLAKTDSISPELVSAETVDDYVLFQNYPNPFNPTTKINFKLKAGGYTTLKVFDILGNEIATLVNEAVEPGNHIVLFDATGLASGVYVYRIESPDFVDIKKMILLR